MSVKAISRLFTLLFLVLGIVAMAMAGSGKSASDKTSGGDAQDNQSHSDKQKGKKVVESHEAVDPSQYVGAETCKSCHEAETRSYDKGPHWKTALDKHHGPQWEGCEACHLPHGSTNSRLLRRPVVFTLCLECHNGGGRGTRNTGVDITTSTHNLLDPKFQRCTTCHVRIHGSNVDATFLR